MKGERIMSNNNTGAQASQQPPKPDPALKRLNAFIGKWNTEGQIKESPFGPAGKLLGRDTYEWLAGGFFLIHRVDVRMSDQKNESIEVIGYDASSKTYPMHSFDSQGNAIAMQANVTGDTWTFTGESMRFTGVFSNDGKSISGKWEYLSDDSKWHHWMDVKLIKAE
jgi:uncharacterized protein DUF1579